jgi:uncharacterized protein (TIGR02145 family)
MKKIIFLLTLIMFFNSCKKNPDGSVTVVPIAPSNLTAIVISNTQVNLSWSDLSTNETGFKIERKIGAGIFVLVSSVGTNITTYSDNGLSPNTTYTYRVFAYNSAGPSLTYSNEVTVSTGGATGTNATICSQVWMTQNLDVNTYRNGDPIPQVTDPIQWANLTTGAWCYYNNDPAHGAVYGKLYNWHAVNDPRGLAPTGWHVPSNAEWTTLESCLGGGLVAGGKMKELGILHWNTPNTGATNSSGFTGLPGGRRSATNGMFVNIGLSGNLWTSTEISFNNTRAGNWSVYHDGAGISSQGGSGDDKKVGLSVRCIKN